MKYLKRLILSIVLGLFLVPNFVNAEEKFNLYVFWGDGCPHCEAALTYLDSLDEETKSKFNLVKYEVWNNKENSELMTKVANNLGVEAEGVPFIVIGENHLSGYSESSNSTITDYINTEYNNKDKVDYVKDLDIKKTNKIDKTSNIWSLIIIIGLSIVVGVIYGIKYITKENKN